ncbi:MAG: glycosyltransferase [Verrucomicrobiales bacterium]|nr:glycosyltransferase [Nitrospinaceae bacterium]
MNHKVENRLVSVITATYNRADYLSLAIESVLNQSYKNIEYHIVDDGSTDNTCQVLEAYLKDKRVHCYYQENQGQSAARNLGVKKARGEFICFLDSDNIWELNKLEQQLEFSKLNPEADIVYGDGRLIDEDGNMLFTPVIKRYSGFITEKLLMNNFISNNTVMSKRRCFEELGQFNEALRYAEDYDLWLRMSTRFTFNYQPKSLVKYRTSGNRLSVKHEEVLHANHSILDLFFKTFPNVVSHKIRRKAWCLFHTRKGRYDAGVKQYSQAIENYMKAIRYKPLSIAPWRAILRMILDLFKSLTTRKELKKYLLRMPFFFTFTSFLTRKTPRIFMYHRFNEASSYCPDKLSSDIFNWQLKKLSKGWKVITLGEYANLQKTKSRMPSYLVVLTVDDGYADFYKYAYPLVKQYGLKITFFPVVKFINGAWLWWDRVNYALEQTDQEKNIFHFNGKAFTLDLKTSKNQRKSFMNISDYCTRIDDGPKWELIYTLEKYLGVIPPPSPPSDYSPVTWEQLKEMSAHGVEIGGHTMSHPILSKIPKENVVNEIIDCKREIESNIGKVITSFCYPNGLAGDLNEAICRCVEEAGYDCAVLSYKDKSNPSDFYRTNRMGLSNDKTDFLWKLCGMESLTCR